MTELDELKKEHLLESQMSLKLHLGLNQSQIKALCEEKFHQTCLPVSTPSNMVFIPLFVRCVCFSLCASTHIHTVTLYKGDQTSLWLWTSRPLCQLWLSLCLLHCSTCV